MINSLDFKSIKRGVKLESVLRHYHVELRRSGKDQCRGCCPIHRGDGREAFHVNLARNIFHCFACGCRRNRFGFRCRNGALLFVRGSAKAAGNNGFVGSDEIATE